MRLTFLGAAQMVTGSCCLLEAGGLRLLVDCGLFQGRDERLNQEPFPFNPAGLDGVILTHAHIDHSGRLPLLRRQGYHGPIFTHPATADLAEIMLEDSAYIQESEVERANRKARRAGHSLLEPLYTRADARAVTEQFRTHPYGERFRLSERVEARFQDAGHILGSAIVELFVLDEAGQETKIVFSGDIGQPGRPILRDPTPIEETDYLVLESTYGNRLHDPPESTREGLLQIIRSTIGKGGNVIIPAFAVGRTQEILYQLNHLAEGGALPPKLKVVLDSPLAIAATEITARHAEVFDDAARYLVKQGDHPFSFPGMEVSQTADDSRALNLSKKPMVVIAASGMCEAGRVVHHLKHNLWRDLSTVLFVGFQADGTLGRRLADGAGRVRIHGEDVAVRCRIESLHGFSAHADQRQLLDWVGKLKRPPRATFLVHGEPEAQEELARLLAERGHQVEIPALSETTTLVAAGRPLRLLAPRRQAKARLRRTTRAKSHLTLAREPAQALASERMSVLLRELRQLRKLWFSSSSQLAPERAAEIADRADEILRAVEQMRRLMS